MNGELTLSEQTQLQQCEVVIEHGLQTFVEVGNALLTIRDNRLYRLNHATFEDYCRDRWEMERRHAYRLMDAAGVVENVSNWTQAIPATESQVRPLTSLPAEEQPIVWQRAVETAPNGKVTAAHVAEVAREYKLPAANHATSDGEYDGDEWYTPQEYIKAARLVMGGIDFDPASCLAAQSVVTAKHYYTKQDNALTKEWAGRVWLNPPYSYPLIEQFVNKLNAEYQAQRVTAAIIITNNSSDTFWFHSLLQQYPACFTRGRVSFWRKEGQERFAARQGQTIFYLGPDEERFACVFAEFGQVVKAYDY